MITDIAWLVTMPKFRSLGDMTSGGWKLHAVPGADKMTEEETNRKRSLCGIRAAHGWAIDLFIEDECERCRRILDKRLSRQVARGM